MWGPRHRWPGLRIFPWPWGWPRRLCEGSIQCLGRSLGLCAAWLRGASRPLPVHTRPGLFTQMPRTPGIEHLTSWGYSLSESWWRLDQAGNGGGEQARRPASGLGDRVDSGALEGEAAGHSVSPAKTHKDNVVSWLLLISTTLMVACSTAQVSAQNSCADLGRSCALSGFASKYVKWGCLSTL